MKRFNKKDLFTIPNLMGYFRILLIPVFCYFYIKKQAYLLAAGIVLISSLTDLFDGYIARRFNMVTELGKALDPVADKLTHAALALCLAFRYPLMWALLALMAVVLLVLFFFPHLPLAAVNALILITMADMLFTLCMYIPVFHRMRKS